MRFHGYFGLDSRVIWRGIGVLMLVAATGGYAAEPGNTAEEIFLESGVRGGLVVHLGVGDGRLTAALRPEEPYLVQGLDTCPDRVSAAAGRLYLATAEGQLICLGP